MYSQIYYQRLSSDLLDNWALTFIKSWVIEEFLYAYSKKTKAALNPLRRASLFLQKKEKRKRSVTALKTVNEYSL